MKKRSFLIILVAITLLSTILLSSILGVTKAEYFKKLSKAFDFEASPDLKFQYNLYIDRTKTPGVYKNSKNISQEFTKSNKDSDFLKIKIPVTEVGYYTLSFNVDFWTGEAKNDSPVNLNSDDDTSSKTYLSNLRKDVGCQVYSEKLSNTVSDFFDNIANVKLFPRDDGYNSYYYGTGLTYETKSLLDAKGHYRWTTITPSRAENVELTFYASAQDVEDGFMVWYWDFWGLETDRKYALKLNEISIKKQEPRENLPYIEFGDTKYVNNVKNLGTVTANYGSNRPNPALGTYATTATFDKLVMQLNPLWDAAENGNSTPMSLSVPIKNVKANTSYKVYFDFSIAMQGSSAPYAYNNDYKSFFESDLYFKSYLHNGPVDVDTVDKHKEAIKTVTNANKVFANKEMTDYSDLMDKPDVDDNNIKLDRDHTLEYLDATTVGVRDNLYLKIKKDNGTENEITVDSMTHAQAMNYGVTTLGGNKHTQGLGDSLNYGVNWLNAIRHSEVNSETKIHWLTFYNSTFTFNVTDGVAVDANGYLTNLNWVWAIDGLVPINWYRIRIDNVRIEEVVPYGSFQINGMLNIAGTDREDFGLALYDTLARDNFVRSTFRYSNGTGQNYRPRGYVDTDTDVDSSNLLNNEVLSANNIFGAIYDAGDIIIKETEKTDKNNPLGNYVIGLRGYTAVKGGVHKYVWSADGGKTWNDMLYAPTFYNGEYQESLRAPRLTTSGEPNMITKICESFVDQGFIGVKDYSNKIARYENTANKNEDDPLYKQTMGDYIYVKDTLEEIKEGDKSHTYSKEEKDGTGDFVDFVHGVDDVNSVYVYMQADLSEYKDQANLDIVFAAVPEENLNARCEILRIINYNPRPDYHTRSMSIVSDIKIKTESGATESNLTATYNANGNHNKKKFALLSGAYVNSDQYTNAPTGYGHLIETFETYDELRTTFSDIPIKNKLTVKGVAFVEGGTEKYYWSVDYGKTWTECETVINASCTKHSEYKEAFYDGTKTRSDDTAFNKNICFDCGTSGITANLIDYEGQVVDVIFAAKSNLGGPLCPVGRIDNVAVYGQNGTFYTRLHHVVLDQCNEYVNPTYKFPDETTWLSRVDNWNLGLNGHAYTIFEPNNVNVANTRLYYTEAAEMQSGGRVTIDGYVVCKGGVSRYKYSLDGGKTWTVINDTGAKIKDTSKSPDNDKSPMITEAQKSDSSFTSANDGKGGDYCCCSSGTPLTIGADFYKHALEFNLPALPAGTERNLLVVAENKTNKLIPVLHIKLKFKYANGNTMQYGYHSSINRTDLTTLNAGYVSEVQSWKPTLTPMNYPMDNYYKSEKLAAYDSLAYDRFTIPVTEAGDFKLAFNHRLANPAKTASGTIETIHNYKGDTTYAGSITGSISIPKTHFVEGEDIPVTFKLTTNGINSSKKADALKNVTVAIVSAEWKNQSNQNRYAVYWVNELDGKALSTYADNKEHVISDIYDLHGNNTFNKGIPAYLEGLPAGKYTLFFYNQGVDIQKIDATSGAKNPERWLIAQMTGIYIHSKDEVVDFSVIHDEGEYTSFSDLNKTYSNESAESNPNVDPIFRLEKPFDNDDGRGIVADVKVTPADVRRGYIVLDVNYSKLWRQPTNPPTITTPNNNVQEKITQNVTYNITIRFGQTPLVKKAENISTNIPFAGSSTGYGTTTMKIPVSEAGTYDFSFGGYLDNSVTHRGYDKGKTGWTDGLKLTLNYSGAAMSVPKTVYKVGEDIPIRYYTKGSVAATSPVKETGNLPWIGILECSITKDPDMNNYEDYNKLENIEKSNGVWNKRNYVKADTAGVKYISTAGIEPGTYQIYLRDNSAMLFHGKAPVKYWWEYDMVHPITITIVESNNVANAAANVKYSFSNVINDSDRYTSGTADLSQRVFYQGDNINVDINVSDLNQTYRLVLCKADDMLDNFVAQKILDKENGKTKNGMYTIYTSNFTYKTEDGELTSKQREGGNEKIPPGKYTLYFINKGSIIGAQSTGCIYAVMDITILPAAMKNNVKGATQIHSLELSEGNIVAKPQDVTQPTIVSDPFSYYTVSGTFTATQQDVERGYVMFEYDFTGLGSSVDLSFVIDKFTVTKRESS